MTEMNPTISVIIPVHDAGAYLRPCVESVLKQTLPPTEVILVVDCPTDGSDRTAAQLAVEDSRIRLVRHRENMHIGLSRNDGLLAAKGEYVAFVDHDDLCEPQMLERLYSTLSAANADIALSPIGEMDGNGQKSTVNGQRTKPLANRRSILKDTLSQGTADSYEPQTAVVIGALFKRAALKGLEFADTRTTSAEDWLFLTEAMHRAGRVEWANETLYHHRNTATNTGSTYEYRSAISRVNTISAAYAQHKQWEDQSEWLQALQMGCSKMIIRSLPVVLSKDYKEAIRLYRGQSWLKMLFRPELLPAPQGFLGKLYRNIIVNALTK